MFFTPIGHQSVCLRFHADCSTFHPVLSAFEGILLSVRLAVARYACNKTTERIPDNQTKPTRTLMTHLDLPENLVQTSAALG